MEFQQKNPGGFTETLQQDKLPGKDIEEANYFMKPMRGIGRLKDTKRPKEDIKKK